MADKPPSRLGRLTRLGGLSSRISASYVGQRIAGAFQDEETRERALRRLHVKNARRMVETMGKLKGAAMKVGQTAALMAESLDLPPEVAGTLSELFDRAEPVPFNAIRAEVEAELDGSLDDLFDGFDPVPIGTASLGQAHAARLPDGTPVVVKVLHRGIAGSVDTDLAALKAMLRSSRALRRSKQEIDGIFDEIHDRLHEELDYYLEASHIEFFRGVQDRLGGMVVPATHPEYCTARVLTMDRLDGVGFAEFLPTASPEARHRAGETLIAAGLQMTFHLRTLHADPHGGNFLFTEAGEIGLLDFGCVKTFDAYTVAEVGRFTRGLIDGHRGATLRACRDLDVLVTDSHDAADVLWDALALARPPLIAPTYVAGSDDAEIMAGWTAMWPRFVRHPNIRYPWKLLFLDRALSGMYAMLQRMRHPAPYGELLLAHAEHAIGVADGTIVDEAPGAAGR